jgi:hypothetical protein
MVLDWAHLKKTRRINIESSTRLESTGSMKMWETKTWRSVKEEIGKNGKTWREVKRLANNTTKWKNFTSALCSETSNRR